MLGVDLFDRYQDVTDWRRVRDAGVRFCIIKATDGAGRATAPADVFVRGARTVGIPVGLYHYAQLTPTPEAQAAVLAGEVRRLAPLQLPPALDLEGDFHPRSTDSALVRAQKVARATDFARRFLLTLGAAGHPRTMLYANTSFLAQLRPETWGIPGLLIWAADYGPNDGTRHPDLSPYTGPVAIHQYTDRGTVPGVVSGGVDLNWALTDITTTQEDDMALFTDQHAAQIDWIYQQLTGSHTPGEFPGWPTRRDGEEQQSLTVVDYLREMDRRVAALARPGTLHLDEAQLADLRAAIVAAGSDAEAEQVMAAVETAIRAAFARAAA